MSSKIPYERSTRVSICINGKVEVLEMSPEEAVQLLSDVANQTTTVATASSIRKKRSEVAGVFYLESGKELNLKFKGVEVRPTFSERFSGALMKSALAIGKRIESRRERRAKAKRQQAGGCAPHQAPQERS